MTREVPRVGTNSLMDGEFPYLGGDKTSSGEGRGQIWLGKVE